MPRIAMAVPVQDDEANSTRVDDLIQRGRSQGHLSLSDLRTAFEQAGLTAAEARSILRELSEAGVRLADEKTETKDSAVSGSLAEALQALATAKPAKKSRSSKTEAADAEVDGDVDFGDEDVASIKDARTLRGREHSRARSVNY